MTRFPRSLPARALLAAPSALYGLAVRARNAWYDRPSRSERAPIPVVSIGNLAAGGTGKTPLVLWLARRLLHEGIPPAIVSRGYGGNAGPGPLVVSHGAGPRVDARACGDEPLLLARAVPQAVVVVGADRVEGVRAAASLGARVAILDDGFQHRRIARDLDVVLLDGRGPFDGGLLPGGPLREPPSSLRRAGVVVLTRLAASDTAERAVASVRATGYAGPIVRAGHVARGFVGRDGRAVPAPAGAVAFSGIGDPERFRTDLEAAGVKIARFVAFRDHHVLSAPEMTRLADEARALDLPLVTTEKDLARAEPAGARPWGDVALLALAIEARVWDEAVLLGRVRGILGARR